MESHGDFSHKYAKIEWALRTNNWSKTGDDITYNDLLIYIKMKVDNNKIVDCPLCKSNLSHNKFTFTSRYAKFLMMFNLLSEMSTDTFVHYKKIQDETSKKCEGISVTSYGNLSRPPWEFLLPRINEDNKICRDGFFKPSENLKPFLRNELAIPEWIETLNGVVINSSDRKIYMSDFPDISFKDLVKLYKTF